MMTIKPLNAYEIDLVAKGLPVLAMDGVAKTEQELGARAKQWVIGKNYNAQILSKHSETSYQVMLEGADHHIIILSKELGDSPKIGEKLMLRYVQDKPQLIFMRASIPSASSIAELSPSALLINQRLTEAATTDGGVPIRYEAVTMVSQYPQNPALMANDLKHALTSSGLFYESNLQGLLEGNKTLATILQQPQNQDRASISVLMAQQLTILEKQHLAWHGEIWPNQFMDWDVYLQQRNQSDHQQSTNAFRSASAPTNDNQFMVTELTLDFPRLGKVFARLSLMDGRMRIRVMAESMHTLDQLEGHKHELSIAIGKNGLTLDALTVMKHE
jgi:hypothetical protein